jgi:DNA-binding MarR family transcriptional regulator
MFILPLDQDQMRYYLHMLAMDNYQHMQIIVVKERERQMTKTKDPPVAASESRCSCTALRKATRRISQLYDMVLAPSGLKTTQRAVLAQIGRSEPTTVGALAEALVMDSGALAHTLKPLERDGFVAVTVDPGDRRNRLIRLTRQGRAKLEETDMLWARAQGGFDATFGQIRSDEMRKAMEFLVSDGFVAAFESAVAER